MTAVVFLLYDGIEKEIVKGIYLVLEINRRIMTYLYSKTIFCALMDSYKWMTNISTPYAYQIETKKEKMEEAKNEPLSKYLEMVILHVQMCISFYNTLLLICVIEIVFL